MPKKGNRKRLKFRAQDVCLERVTVADYADSDPARVKSGRVKKAVANAIQKEVKLLCGLEASQVPVEEVLSSLPADGLDCNSTDAEDSPNELNASRKKKTKRNKDYAEDGIGKDYPIDIWLLLASYIRPEDICKFALICKSAWIVTCIAAFWTRLYKRFYNVDACLPMRLQPESMQKLRGLRACVIRALYYMYEPFCSRILKQPPIPDSTPNTLHNSKCLLFWCQKVVGSRPEPLWEFNFKFRKEPPRLRNGCQKRLQFPQQYQDVHTNPDQDSCLLQVSTLNFIFIPVVLGMTLTLFTISVSTDMRHHRVRLVFQDSPVPNGKKPRGDHGVQVVLDPVHSVRLLSWWHPQYPLSLQA
ncbi:transmembrane protein 183A [Latimeria chalumnae]|uniref:Transmembrane protein 183A n=1 Tax=Latimeria chalumnae TaxID=7897 RepID=H3BFA7_LATCH|nr:PREDICTED: transmembrane protein 183-like [Latimeria chalumnae]|eukprot:XP_005988507.1 PREDICTED: transmembrane protein 183-like [Latimeria chalumnae]